MKVGDLVKVETKYCSRKLGLIVKHGMDGYFVQTSGHPRMIIARPEDCEVVSEDR